MDKLKTELGEWVSEIGENRSPVWEKLPDLDLYMDQVIVLMEKYLDVYERDGGDKLITPSMINNYVKLGLISPPENKKYSRRHIAYLMVVCILKQILPISKITDLINNPANNMNIDELFDLFSRELDKAFVDVGASLNDAMKEIPDEEAERYFNLLALKLTVSANANKLAAEKIIFLLKEREKEREKQKQTEKEKEKSKQRQPEKE